MSRPTDRPSALSEALRTVRERADRYGPPHHNLAAIAQAWGAYLGLPLTAEDVCMMMVLLKVMREGHQHSWDNWVDIAGYVRCAELCRRPEPSERPEDSTDPNDSV